MSKITDRILNQLGDPDLIEKLCSLSNSDLNSVLLEVMGRKASEASPGQMLKTYSQNRFAAPSGISPDAYHLFEAGLLELAKSIGIDGKLLSPVAPLGSCSAFGCVDQNNIMSAIRGTEVLADPTNMLAVMIADGLKTKTLDNHSPKHFCTTARVVRAQPACGKGSFAHFGLFCMVSTGKDTGSYSCEKELLVKQLQYYKLLLLEKYSAKLTVTLRKRGGYKDQEGFFEKIAKLIQSELPDTPFDFDLEHEDNLYYKGINFKIYLLKGNDKIEIGDGGFVDWTQQMTGNKKERLLISGIGLERILLENDRTVMK